MSAEVSIPPSWHALVASVRGAVHERNGVPLQDAAGVWPAEPPVGAPWRLVGAVADGHGHPRHFRSGRGADLAIRTAERIGGEMAPQLASCADPEEVGQLIGQCMVPALLERWREAVDEDLTEHPLSEEGDEPVVSAVRESPRHEAEVAPSPDPALAREHAADRFLSLLPYGTTLLVAEIVPPWLALVQIGDGDISVTYADGTTETPVPWDPRLDGSVTTSLCQPDALGAFRHAVVDLRGRPVRTVLLATDGFGNSQRDVRWQEAVGRDVLELASRHGLDWLRAQLPLWAARCASGEGSGDDTSLVLLLADQVFRGGQGG